MINEKIYYDNDADIAHIKDKSVGIIGYGIQGRSQALNLRDSGINILISNRSDGYLEQIREDGFTNHSIESLVRNAQIIMMLIPDAAQGEVYKKIEPHLNESHTLVFAHGYALRFNTINLSNIIDVVLLAPRMPGFPIRNNYIKGHGVPAFIDVIQDNSSQALENVLALAKAIGFTRPGVLQVDYRVETELDLFIEQYVVASFVKIIIESFDVLVNKLDFPAVPTLMELYASEEMGTVLMKAAKEGITNVFQNNASPTCQFGIYSNYNDSLSGDSKQNITRIIKEIQDGSFNKSLNTEGAEEYINIKKFWDTITSESLQDSQEWIDKSFRGREN